MPLFMGPDENAHFMRAFQVSNGNIISENKNGLTGGYLPNNLIEDLAASWGPKVFNGDLPNNNYFDKNSKNVKWEFVAFGSSAVYSPVAYIPQSVGIIAAKIVHPSAAIMDYFARIVGLTAFIVMTYFAIKITPYGKWVFVFLGLIPMTIQQASTMSGDIMAIGLSFIWVAVLIRLFLTDCKLDFKKIVALVILAMALVLTKPTNAVLLLPFIFIPKKVFGGVLKKAEVVLCTLGFAVLAVMGWYIVIKVLGYNLQINNDASINQLAQLNWIFDRPHKYLMALWNTFIGVNPKNVHMTYNYPYFFMDSFYGQFSWLTYKLPLINIFIGYLALFIVFFHNDGEKLLKKINQLKIFATVGLVSLVLSVIAISTMLYLTWTGVRAPFVSGIQGRYFIGLVPLLIPASMYIKKYMVINFDNKYRMGQIVMVVSSVNFLVMTYLTINWFYL